MSRMKDHVDEHAETAVLDDDSLTVEMPFDAEATGVLSEENGEQTQRFPKLADGTP